MSQKKTVPSEADVNAFAGFAPKQAADVPADAAIDMTEFQAVDLSRTWYKPQEDGAPLCGLVVKLSEDVSSLYQSDYKDTGPKYVAAIELRAPISLASGSLVKNNEPTGGKVGDVVFFFIPKVALGLVRTAYASVARLQNADGTATYQGHAIGLKPIAKRQVKSRSHGMVNAWQWQAGMVRRPVALLADPVTVSIPTLTEAEQQNLLPEATE